MIKMVLRMVIFLFLLFCLSLLFLAQEKPIVSNHSKIFGGFNYQLEISSYFAKPIKFSGFMFAYDFKPHSRLGFKFVAGKEKSWFGDGWDLMLITRRYVPLGRRANSLISFVGLGVDYKIPSRGYYSYTVETKEHVYLKSQQLLGQWKSLVAEFGLRGKGFRKIFFEASLIVKPMNFFVKDKTRLNTVFGSNLALLYCLKR